MLPNIDVHAHTNQMVSTQLGSSLEGLIDQLNKINQFKFGVNPVNAFGSSYDRLEFNELGCNTFDKLFDIGLITSEFKLNSLAHQSEFDTNVIELISKSAQLLFQPVSENISVFLDTYPLDSIQTTGEPFSEDWCIVRSGYQYLLDLYRNVTIDGKDSTPVNAGLNLFETYRLDFDSHLRDWHTAAFDIKLSEVPKHTPHSHWWWFQ